MYKIELIKITSIKIISEIFYFIKYLYFKHITNYIPSRWHLNHNLFFKEYNLFCDPETLTLGKNADTRQANTQNYKSRTSLYY